MRTAIAMPVLAFLTLAVHSATGGDWNSLGRVPKARTVKVHLKSGRNLKGTILQVGDEGLRLVPQKSRTQVRINDLTRSVDSKQVGQPVELTTRSGQTLRGVLQGMDGERLWLDEARNALQIGRTEIRRVTWRSRRLGALIGLGIGAGAGAALYENHDFDITALLGTAAGAIVGMERTIYDSASPSQTGRP